jgi:hypothetical protein
MPYGYYQLVRFVAMFGFSFFAFSHYQINDIKLFVFYIGLAILFQPFYKIALGRALWNIIDIAISSFLLVSIFHSSKRSKKV